ncbi:SUKH-4 family immunity protein [Actinomadura chibensis]|uniref:SUKH-4 family immunity protein n=1 Tax=Actinomadura chibensis TaxID=392828 RepID=A0A5D0NQH0_9ACTN|nr:SUKH-4 family immunity protein [Actinomadura chibensis]TYB46900.1 hypothetical protein FXF69_17190 [Actinomadura chibensis]
MDYRDMVELWGEDGLLYVPMDRIEHMRFDLARLSPEAAIPAEVQPVFSAYIEGEVGLFNVLDVQIADRAPLALIALGAVPEQPMYYCLDGDTGAVVLLTLDEPADLETINTTLSAFVEFLFHLQKLIHEDEGRATRAAPAARLRERLTLIDPHAFRDPESWWNAAFMQLEGRI